MKAVSVTVAGCGPGESPTISVTYGELDVPATPMQLVVFGDAFAEDSPRMRAVRAAALAGDAIKKAK